MTKKNLWLSGGTLVLAVFIAVGIFYGRPLWSYVSSLGGLNGGDIFGKDGAGTSSSGTKMDLPSGRQVYRVAQAEGVWPKILEAVIDPPDVHVGDIQRLTLTVQSPEAIVSVEARTELDHGTKVIPLQLAGDSDPNDDSYVYAAEWEVHDTHDAVYRTAFVVKDAKGRESKVTLAWSDLCAIPMYGDWSLSSVGDCTINQDDGIEAGTVTINGGGTLTINTNADFVLNPGYAITLTSGSIVISSGSSIFWDYIWAYDGDSDGYTNESQGLILQTDSPGGWWRRRSTRTGIGDCDDVSETEYQSVSNLMADWDRDGYPDSGSVVTYCVGAASSYAGRTYFYNSSDIHACGGAAKFVYASQILGGTDSSICDAGVH